MARKSYQKISSPIQTILSALESHQILPRTYFTANFEVTNRGTQSYNLLYKLQLCNKVSAELVGFTTGRDLALLASPCPEDTSYLYLGKF